MPEKKLAMQVIEGDPYGAEYAAIVEMEIFKPGHWNWTDVTPEMVEEIALSYDASFVRAPIVIDHVERGPAFGHVLDLDFRDNPDDKGEFGLYAKVGLLDTGVELLKSGEFNERSVCISRYYPVQGLWYLNHLALLGAANPAVTGMAPIVILEGEEEPEESELAALIEDMPKLTFMSEKTFTWDQGEEFLRYKVRNLSRFKGKSLRTWDLDAEKAIAATGGKLKPEYLPEGSDKGSMFIQSVLFDVEQWDLKKAQKWIGKNLSNLSKDVDASFVKTAIELAETEGEGFALGSEEHFADAKARNEHLKQQIGIKDEMIKLLESGKILTAPLTSPPPFNKDDYFVIDPAELNTEQVSNQTTAQAGGGNQMPGVDTSQQKSEEEKTTPTPAPPGDIQKAPLTAEDIASVEATNFALQAELDMKALEARKAQERYEAELQRKGAELRVTTIRTKVQHMVTLGYLIPAQIDAGLIAALAEFPEGAKVGEEDPVDIILNCLKQTGKLNLRTDIVVETPEGEPQQYPDLDKFGQSGKATRVDLAKRVRQLMEEDPKLTHSEAFIKAEKELGGGR